MSDPTETQRAGAEGPGQPRTEGPLAYLVARFPVVSETFVMNEILEMERQGERVELLPLRGSPDPVVHEAAVGLARRAHRPTLVEVLGAQLHWLRRRPWVYTRMWVAALRGYGLRPRTLASCLYILPVSAAHARTVERLGVSHVHAHFATHAALGAWVVKALTGVPYSVTAHSHDLTMDYPMLGVKLAGASRVVVISDYYRDYIADALPSQDMTAVHVIRCGVDTSRLAPSAPRADAGVPTVVCPGRLVPMKGHRYLLEALSRLQREGVALRVEIAGGGALRGELEVMVRDLGLEDRVSFRGQLTHDRMLEALRGADIVCLPSVVTEDGEQEGIPVALMEAMAFGAAVISTDTSGVAELVRDDETGLLVPPGDADALAEALRRLALDPDLRARLGSSGRRIVEEGYDLRTNTGRLRTLIGRAS